QGTGAFGPHRWRADSVRKDSDSHTRRELATAVGPHPSLHHAGTTPHPNPRGDAAHTHPTPGRPPLVRAFSPNSARSYVHTSVKAGPAGRENEGQLPQLSNACLISPCATTTVGIDFTPVPPSRGPQVSAVAPVVAIHSRP